MDWVARNSKYTLTDAASGFSIAFAGMNFNDSDIDALSPLFERAKKEVARIEAGDIKNPDENRRVTHFTDRITYTQSALYAEVEDFAEKVRSGEIRGATGKSFDALVVNGIGGSALGPQLMQFAINGPYWNEFDREKRKNNLKLYFLV